MIFSIGCSGSAFFLTKMAKNATWHREIENAACGDCNPRVRRLTFPQAAFWLAKYDLKISDLLNRLSFSVLLGRNACLLTEKATKMRLVFEPHQSGYLLDALTAVAEADLSGTHDFIAN